MVDDYGYINARIRGMKGRLLRRRDFENALALDTADELLSFLDSTPYGPDIEHALTLRKGISGIDEGLRRNLEKTFDGIAAMASERPRDLILILMGRWELLNIKTILRGKHVNATLEVILANLVPFGRLDDVALRELASQKDIKGVIDLMAQWRVPYASNLRKAYPLYRDRGDFQALEQSLDRAYFDAAMRSLSDDDPDDKMVREVLRQRIDMILIGYALRVVHYGLPEPEPESIFIPGGKEIKLPAFKALLASRDMNELAKNVQTPCYRACLEAGAAKYMETQKLSTMERSMEACFIQNACKSIHLDPLSIAVPIGYLWLKVNEIVNLRLISRGKFTDMPREDIEQYMVYI